MYLDQIDLELDNVEGRGAGRVPQEMAKSRWGQGSGSHPKGIKPGLLRYKMEKTQKVVGASITQVLRKEGER